MNYSEIIEIIENKSKNSNDSEEKLGLDITLITLKKLQEEEEIELLKKKVITEPKSLEDMANPFRHLTQAEWMKLAGVKKYKKGTVKEIDLGNGMIMVTGETE